MCFQQKVALYALKRDTLLMFKRMKKKVSYSELGMVVLYMFRNAQRLK